MQSLDSAVRFLYSLGNEIKSMKLGLERITTLLAALGQPQARIPTVHVAGTNGKGSVCAMLESSLRAAGYRTGLFTSPHLVSPTERIQVNGIPVNESEFLHAFAAVHETSKALLAAGKIDCHPTYFETITAMGFWHFAASSVERLVLEVGLGGRLDATNVVDPLLSVITPIDYDHQQYLGDTLYLIAREKAGIIKPGRPVVLAPQPSEARPAFVGDIEEVSSWTIDNLKTTHRGCSYVAHKGDATLQIRCPLPGPHQIGNSLCAAVALHKLGLSREHIEAGIAQVKWPGRLELLRESPLTYLDGAHNAGGAAKLREFMLTHFADRPLWLVFGVMRDKAVAEIANLLFPLATHVILTRAGQERALEPEAIAALTPHPHQTLSNSVPEAIALLADAPADAVIFITGSLFVVGEARPLLQ